MVWFTLPSFRWLGFWGEVWVLFDGGWGDWRVVERRGVRDWDRKIGG